MEGLDNLSKVAEENFDFIQKCFEEILSGLEYKEKDVDIKKESLSGMFREVDLARKSVEPRLLHVLEKEKELRVLQENGFRAFDLRKKEVDSVLEDIKVREERLNEKEELVQGFFNGIELEIKKFEGIQKSMVEMFSAISLKEMQVENCWRELSLIKNEIERKTIEISVKEEKLESQRKNIELREKALALRNNKPVAKRNEIELKGRGLNFKTAEEDESSKFRHGRKGGYRLPKVDAADPGECREFRINGKKRARTCKVNELYVRPESTLQTDIAERTVVDKFEVEYDDPEFHDFERKGSCFAVDQFWACYDNVDLMPRFYAKIKKVNREKFELHVLWLEVDPGCRCEVDSVVKDLPVACGKFLCETSEDIIGMHSCSHPIHCGEDRFKGYYMIYPRKSEIWALFKDLAVRKTSNSGNIEGYDYEIVVVLSDFDETTGIRVAYLDKLEGYVSLFQRKRESTSFMIRPNQLFRFSHQIPFYQMNGTERKGIPGGCFELDPASLSNKMCKKSLSI